MAGYLNSTGITDFSKINFSQSSFNCRFQSCWKKHPMVLCTHAPIFLHNHATLDVCMCCVLRRQLDINPIVPASRRSQDWWKKCECRTTNMPEAKAPLVLPFVVAMGLKISFEVRDMLLFVLFKSWNFARCYGHHDGKLGMKRFVMGAHISAYVCAYCMLRCYIFR